MKFCENTFTYGYGWEHVSAGHWIKYPVCLYRITIAHCQNQSCDHVIAVDTLNREVDAKTGVLRTERLITCKQNVPAWILRFTGGDGISYVREISEVDPTKKTVVLKSVNLTCANLLRINETCSYTQSPFSSSQTEFKSSSKIMAFTYLSRLSNKIEDWSAETIMQNAKRGKEGFESVLAMAETAFRSKETN